MIFVSHNLATVRYVSDVVAVMYLGRIVEVGPTDEIVSDPQHPYTRMLLAAVPRLGNNSASAVSSKRSPGPAQPAAGMSLPSTLPIGPSGPSRQICVEQDPSKSAHDRPHAAACHFAGRDRGSPPQPSRDRRSRCQ